MTRSASTGEIIARELREAIFSGRYRPGDRLPSERELAARYEAHRGSAREALKWLEQLRLIEIRPGGARVSPVGDASLEALEHMMGANGVPDPVLFGQCFEIFEILFTGAVRLACERATDEERARFQALMESAAQTATSDEQYARIVGELGELLSTASRNLALGMVRNWLKRIFSEYFGPTRTVRLPRTPRVVAHAKRVQAAFAARDGGAAEQAMRVLLQLSREHLLRVGKAGRRTV